MSAAISAICSPSRVTPSMRAPVSMIVAAWESWRLLRVKVSPFAVVTVNDSGTSPIVTPFPARVQAAVEAGFISTPTPTNANDGPSRTRARAAMASFFTTVASCSYRRGLSSWDSRRRWQVS